MIEVNVWWVRLGPNAQPGTEAAYRWVPRPGTTQKLVRYAFNLTFNAHEKVANGWRTPWVHCDFIQLFPLPVTFDD
jgi:hypothetical protein